MNIHDMENNSKRETWRQEFVRQNADPNTPEFETVDINTALDTIADNYHYCEPGRHVCDSRVFDEVRESLKQSMRLMCLQVIGEDVMVPEYDPGLEFQHEIHVTEACNELKAEMRQRLDLALTKYFGEE